MKFNVNANNKYKPAFFILVLDLICKLNMVSREIKKAHPPSGWALVVRK